MRIVQQPTALAVSNRDYLDSTSKQQRHGCLLPNTIRCIVAGPSNCGKTNVIIALLEHPHGVRFENVYVYSKSLYQPKYQYLATLLKPLKEVGYFPYSDSEAILHPSKAKENSVFIFDDVQSERQAVIRDYFSMGRHSKVDCFYLCQTYSHIPKHLIRDNANLIILFRQDELNLKHVHLDHVTTDMTFDQFKALCALCWKDSYGFLVINKDCDLQRGRYRKGFDKYIYL